MAPAESEASTSPIAGALAFAWTRRAAVAIILLLSAAVGVGLAYILPTRFEASVSLSPAPDNGSRLQFGGALASLGGQLGLDLGGSRTQLRFYPKLLTSYWFLSTLSRREVTPTHTLFEMLEGSAPDTTAVDFARLQDGAVAKLRRLVGVDLDERANVFTLSVRLPARDVALATTSNAVALITEFNTHVRRLQASDNRRFIEQRVDSAHTELNAAEEAEADFLRRNKSYEQSPTLTLDYQRLQRHVALLQDVYVTLSRNLEEARIDEVREAPVLTVVDPPHVGWRRAEPDRSRVVLTTVGLTAALLALWLFYHQELSSALRSFRSA